MIRYVRRVWVLPVLISAAALPAWAQTADPTLQNLPPFSQRAARSQVGTEAPARGRVEEIVVTSQKRSENVRKVPLSVTVLSGAQIKAAHITNFADLTRAVPNLSFSSQAGEGLSNLEIRGISSQAGTATVAVYLDDVSLTTRNIYTQGTTEPRFLDISRVEVLRGPQGTLYGASALGGTLKYISNPPQMDVTTGSLFTELSGTYHGGVNWDEQGVVNVPLSPGKAALRIAAETGGDSGYINNIDPNTGQTIKANINSSNFNDARATLLLTPFEWLSITPSVFWQKDVTHDVDAQYLALPNFQTPKPVAEPGHDAVFVPSMTIKADLGFADLVSVTSNYERHFRRTLDSTVYNNINLYTCDFFDTTPAPCPVNNDNNPNFDAALNDKPSYTFYDNTVRQWSQEFRLVSKPYDPAGNGLPLTWLAGLYYSDEHSTFTDTETIPGINGVFNKFGYSPEDPTIISGTFPGAFTNDFVFHGLRAYDTAQYAVFGEATYYPQPNIRATFGARYLYARDGERNNQDGFYSYGDTGLTTSVSHFYAFTPKFALGWDITPENTAYANISKGYRLGSENRPIQYITGDAGAYGTPSYDLANLAFNKSIPTALGPDKLWNYEVGDKARLFGGRLVANVDAFYIKWDSIQTEIPLVTSGLDFETNAGSATSYGTEVDLHGRVNETLSAGVSGSYVHATLDNGVKIGNTILAGTAPGERVPGVPEFNIDMNARQDIKVTDRIQGFVSVDIPWVGQSHGVPINTNPDYKRPSYVSLDAVTGIDVGRWEITVFGKNLTNNNKIIQRPDIQGSTAGYGFTYLGQGLANTQGFTERPLTVGMNATMKF